MKRTNMLAATAAMALLAAATQAAAATYTLTYEGLVTSGMDTGTFGVIGDLAGYRYTAVFTVDTATPGASVTSFPGFANIYGEGAASPVFATLTINAITRSYGSFSGQATDMDGVVTGFGDDSQAALAYSQEEICGGVGEDCLIYDLGVYHAAASKTNDLADGDLETAPPSHIYGPNDFTFAGFHDRRTIDPWAGTFEYRAQGRFLVEKLTVTSGAVPEPTTWALLILGFGMAGAGLRRLRPLHAA